MYVSTLSESRYSMAKVKTEQISEDVLVKPRREPLSRERIIRTAVRIKGEEGLDALSMRRMGRELGVEAMSLYNHVRDKEDILDSICEAVLSEFRIPNADGWSEGARLAAREYRRNLHSFPTRRSSDLWESRPCRSTATCGTRRTSSIPSVRPCRRRWES